MWGLHNHIVGLQIKIRATEDLIDCVQRFIVKSDKKTEKELKVLKLLRDRTFDDIRFFVSERDKRIWRSWRVTGQTNKSTLKENPIRIQLKPGELNP